MFDLDSNHTINRAEFTIGVRSLLHGLALFFDSAVLPCKRELEEVTWEVFDRLDEHKSGFVTLGELLNWCYRTGELKSVFSPFPATDDRFFEHLVNFPRDCEEFEYSAVETVRWFQSKLHISPQADATFRRRTSIGLNISHGRHKRTPPKEFSKAHAWFIYRVFVTMAGGETHTVIPYEHLHRMLSDDQHEMYIHNVVASATRLATEVIGPQTNKFGRRTSIVGDAKDLTRLTLHLEKYFQNRHAGEKLDALGEGSVTLRAFFCVILHSLPEGEIETCLRWCQAFRAHDVLREYVTAGQTQDLGVEDVKAIFHAMDSDGNGSLSVQELMDGGDLEEDQAQQLLKRLDEDHNGFVSVEELQGILRSMDRVLRHDFREAFERDVHRDISVNAMPQPLGDM
jgi:Ca2+-binding EF-hand superfamily protein